ncbi:MAG: hypothetical protein AAFR81_25075 [Chloroflexota bacterium]
MADAAPQLQQAYDLIESGDLDAARQLLEDIRPENENNPDYWWVYTHAAEDAQDGRTALNKVRQLAPNYPGLVQLSQELGIEPPQAIPPQSLPPESTSQASSSMDGEFDKIADEFEGFDDDEDEFNSTGDGGNNLTPIFLGVAVVAIVIIAVLFLLNILSGGDTTPIATDVADGATEAPVLVTADPQSLVTDTEIAETEPATDETEEATEIVTEEVDPTDTESVATAEIVATDTNEPTDEPSPSPEPTATDEPEPEDPFESVADDLATFGVPTDEDAIAIETTDAFGDTYIVTTCSALGPIATQNILGIIDSLAPNADTFAEAGVDGVAFEITDCETENVRITLGVDSEILASYWAGDTSVAELQSALRRLN